jgi:hypothetical protein
MIMQSIFGCFKNRDYALAKCLSRGHAQRQTYREERRRAVPEHMNEMGLYITHV